MHVTQLLKLDDMITCIAISEPRRDVGPCLCDGILHSVNIDIELHVGELSESTTAEILKAKAHDESDDDH